MKSIPPSRGLIRKLLGQYWLLSLGLLIVLTWQTIGILTYYVDHSRPVKLETVLEELAVGAIEIYASVVVSVLIFSYLHNKRKSCFFQSIPCTRDQLFLCSYGSGIALYALPLLLSTVFGILNLLLLKSSVLIPALLQATAYRFFVYLAFFAFATMGMVLSGRTFFGLLTALFLSLCVPLAETLLCSCGEILLYGIPPFSGPTTGILSPFDLYYPNLSDGADLIKGGIYAAASLLLGFVAMLIHRRRKEERVGDSLVFSFILSVLQVFLTVIFSLFLAALVSLVFTEAWIIPLLVPLSVPAFFLARMLLLRSKKVFQKKAILGCILYVLALGGLFLSLKADLFGIVRKIPDADRVQEVHITFDAMEYTSRDSQDIEKIIELHSRILQERTALVEEVGDAYYPDTFTLRITYTIGKGRTLIRRYNFSASEECPASQKLSEESKSFFRQDHWVQKKLQTYRDQTTAASFYGKKPEARIYLSTLQIQTFYRCLEEDLAKGIDPLFFFGLYDGSDDWVSVELDFLGNDYDFIIIPPSATATTAFLEEIDRETSPS